MKDNVNCNNCDFNWDVNNNKELKKGYCYMHLKKPKRCSFNTFEYDERLKKEKVA